MTKKISIYHFLIAIMLFSLVLPANLAGAVTEGATGTLTIHKFEQEPGATQGDGDGTELSTPPEGDPLGGVTYELQKTHHYTENPEAWTEIPEGDRTSYTMTTGSDGIATKTLELGRYSVVEVSGPAHVNLNTEKFHIDIPMTSEDGTANNYDVHVYPKNETIRGAVELTKVDGATGEPIQGVTFDLYDTADQKLNDAPLVTDENGKIQVQDLLFNHEGYYFVEVGTVGDYVLGGQVHFTITESGSFDEDGGHVGKVETVTATNYLAPEVDKEVDRSAVNRGEEVTYTIKVDLPEDIAEYKNFVVTDILHGNLEFVSQVPASGFTFNQNGQELTWTGDPANLTPGVVEFTFKAKVSEDAEANVGIDNIATIDYTNKHDTTGEKETEPVTVTPTAGNLTLIKVDGKTGAKLEDAEFKLVDKAGNTVVAPVKTDANGVIYFGELDYGDYQIIETIAPNGYKLLRNPIDVTIDTDNSEQTITVKNYESGGWELPKTGGIGTTVFTLVGLMLMAAAAYLYIRRRRNAAQ